MRRFFVTLAMIALVLAPFGARAADRQIDDRQIAEQIVRGLKQHKASGELEGFNIDLQVDQGVVQLQGHVSTPQQEELALRIARSVEGVERVLNDIEVRTTAAEPAKKKSLLTDLVGKVAGAKQSQAAATRSSDHRTRLVSAEEDSEETADDSQRIARDLGTKLKAAQKEGKLQGFAIDVQVDNGELWLKGQVSTEEQKKLVLDTARRIRGVRRVVNELTVDAEIETISGHDDRAIAPVQTGATDSEAIAQEVLSQLREQKEKGALKNFGIDVQVDDGVVWMSGYVPDTRQQTIALNIARYIPGVKQVVNDLTVTSGQPTQLAQATSPAQPQRQIVGWALVPANQAQAAAAQPASNQTPLAFAPARPANHTAMLQDGSQPVPMMSSMAGGGVAAARFDHPQLPGYAWPSYASYPNYAALSYPQQYSAAAWPYIGPFYPYPQVPLGWRRVNLEWDDGWWQLDFKDRHYHY